MTKAKPARVRPGGVAEKGAPPGGAAPVKRGQKGAPMAVPPLDAVPDDFMYPLTAACIVLRVHPSLLRYVQMCLKVRPVRSGRMEFTRADDLRRIDAHLDEHDPGHRLRFNIQASYARYKPAVSAGADGP